MKMKLCVRIIISSVIVLVLTSFGYSDFPVRFNSSVIEGIGLTDSCPAESQRLSIKRKVFEAIRDNAVPLFLSNEMRRIAYLEMNNTAETCPSAWSNLTSPVRGCGRAPSLVASCDSVIFPSNGIAYSQVCGRIIGFQQGSPNAFNSSVSGRVGLEGSYIDGVSLTHGQIGSREHIWSFVNAWYDSGSSVQHMCPCMFTNWIHQVPDFIGDDYFCATGNHGSSGGSDTFYTDDPLWDGEGCGPRNTCCTLNNPPWFCKALQQATTDDLEVRICGDQSDSNENTYINFMEIYVR